jgi:hypothetical protein
MRSLLLIGSLLLATPAQAELYSWTMFAAWECGPGPGCSFSGHPYNTYSGYGALATGEANVITDFTGTWTSVAAHSTDQGRIEVTHQGPITGFTGGAVLGPIVNGMYSLPQGLQFTYDYYNAHVLIDHNVITDYTMPGPGFLDFSFMVTPIPEPATWVMMLLGFAGIAGMANRKYLAT